MIRVGNKGKLVSSVPGCTEKRQADELSEEVRCKRCEMKQKQLKKKKNHENATPQKSRLFNENLGVPTG